MVSPRTGKPESFRDGFGPGEAPYGSLVEPPGPTESRSGRAVALPTIPKDLVGCPEGHSRSAESLFEPAGDLYG
jgi:hypothetical protein